MDLDWLCMGNGPQRSLKKWCDWVHHCKDVFQDQNKPMEDAFWCGHVRVTLEQFCYYPSVYDHTGAVNIAR